MSVSAASENVQLKDEVAVTYTLNTTGAGTEVTLLCHYNGVGEGKTSGRSYTLIGTDQQTGQLDAAAGGRITLSSFATLTQAGSAVSVRVRIDYLVTLGEDSSLIVSITGIGRAE